MYKLVTASYTSCEMISNKEDMHSRRTYTVRPV